MTRPNKRNKLKYYNVVWQREVVLQHKFRIRAHTEVEAVNIAEKKAAELPPSKWDYSEAKTDVLLSVDVDTGDETS